MDPVKIERAEVFRYDLPLVAPIQISQETLTRREGLLLKLTNYAGRCAWGEAAPLPGFSVESFDEAADTLLTRAKQLNNTVIPQDLSTLQAFAPLCPAPVSFALETALLNLLATEAGTTFHEVHHPADSTGVPVNALLSGAPEDILARARTLANDGFRAAKLKVGRRTPEKDAALVGEVSAALGANVTLRLDANQAWSLEEALDFADRTKDCTIEYIEEPLADPHELMTFHAQTGIPYALDETFVARDARTEIFEGAAACIWKPTLLHFPGIGGQLSAKKFEVPVHRLVLSAAFESGVGIAALAQYAAAYASPETPIGLDTYSMLAGDVLEDRLTFNGGMIDVNDAVAKSGCVLEDKLQRCP